MGNFSGSCILPLPFPYFFSDRRNFKGKAPSVKCPGTWSYWNWYMQTKIRVGKGLTMACINNTALYKNNQSFFR